MSEVDSEATLVFGPFTPQETDRIASRLQKQGIPFEIHKDSEGEKKFTRNDFQSLVTRAEYRTEIYLAQIFYFTIAPAHTQSLQNILMDLGLGPNESGDEPTNLNSELPIHEQRELSAGTRTKANQKRFVATLLVLFILGALLNFAYRLWME